VSGRCPNCGGEDSELQTETIMNAKNMDKEFVNTISNYILPNAWCNNCRLELYSSILGNEREVW